MPPKPRIGQGRVGLRRKPRMAPPINLPKPLQTPVAPKPTLTPRTVQPLTDSEVQLHQHKLAAPLPPIQQVPTSQKQPLETKNSCRSMPPYHEPFVRPPPRPLNVPYTRDNRKDVFHEDTNRKIDFEEKPPFQEGIISEVYERPDKSYIEEQTELTDLIDTSKLIQTFLPKQVNIDKILDIIKRKVLKGTHLLVTNKEIQAGYLTSPYFKDLYLYLAQNKIPHKKGVVCKVESLAERFVLLVSLLFKIVTT